MSAEDKHVSVAEPAEEHTERTRSEPTPQEESTTDGYEFTELRPSPWRRLAFTVFILLLLWLAFAIYKHVNQPKIIYADRYSAEYKYRPAASPIITELLKDGRTRLRGAMPTQGPTL